MTSGSIIIGDGTTVVDLSTGSNAIVQYVRTNPLFIIPLSGGNQGVINLNLLSVRITVTFDLTDGIGTGSKFDKLLTLSSLNTSGTLDPSVTPTTVVFVWGSRNFSVVIESVTVGTQPGKFNLMQGCSVVLVPKNEIVI